MRGCPLRIFRVNPLLSSPRSAHFAAINHRKPPAQSRIIVWLGSASLIHCTSPAVCKVTDLFGTYLYLCSHGQTRYVMRRLAKIPLLRSTLIYKLHSPASHFRQPNLLWPWVLPHLFLGKRTVEAGGYPLGTDRKQHIFFVPPDP